MGMDWFSWLSRSNLDPSLVYEYGLAFVRNELQKEDLTNFNHEFLQSMGISVAKHRLEILKLAGKEVGAGGGGPRTKSFPKLISAAFHKTRKNITKCVNKLIFHEQVESSVKTLPVPEQARYQYQERWRKALLTSKYKSDEKEMPTAATLKIRTSRGIAKSGPLALDGRAAVAQETKMMLANSRLKLSGPLDRNMQERLLFTYRSPLSSGPLEANRSPRLYGPLEGRPPSPMVCHNNIDYSREKFYGHNTLWAALFQDLKPT